VDIYHLHEGTIEIPDNWQDRSANIFAVGNKLPLDLSFVITREDLPIGADLADFCDQKLSEYETQLKQFKVVEKRQNEVSGIVILEAEFTWRSDMGPMYQRQVYVRNGVRVLMFTATARRELTDEQQAQIDAVVASFQPR